MHATSRLRFANEDLLQKAILGLLARMPGVSDIRLLQGPLEIGKDIVFKYEGPFDEILNCACIVKNITISGKITSRNAANSVLLQARQALTNEYIDGSGASVRVHRVFVITSKHISPQAMASIAGELRERQGQVHFINGEELVRLFQLHWPDFLADEAAALSKYTQAVQSSLNHR